MHDIPEEAVKAAMDEFNRTRRFMTSDTDRIYAALTAALPHLPGVGVKGDDLVERVARAWASIDGKSDLFDECKASKAMEDQNGTYEGYMAEARELIKRAALEPSAADMGNSITDKTVKRRIADALEYVWSALDCDVEHIDSIIAHMQGNGLRIVETGLTVSDADFNSEVGIPATELSTASKMEVVGDLQELLERLDAGLEYEGWMETDGAPVELFDIEAAQDLFADAAAAIRALSSPDHADAGKVEGEHLPQDVINLVIAAREAFDTGVIPEDEEYNLDKALEPFGERVPYENEPDPLQSVPSQEVAGS